MEFYGVTINRRKLFVVSILVVFIVLCGVGVDLYFTFFTPEKIKINEIKQQVSQKIGRNSFTVQQIIVESQGWELARIVSTAVNDSGNPSMVILQQVNGKYVLKFGPGTSFQQTDLEAAGVPLAIQNALFSPLQQALDPIAEHLPYQTNYYSIAYSGKYSGPSGTTETSVDKVLLTVTIYIAPRFGITDTPEREAQYKAEINQWIQSLGLDPNNYIMTFTT